MSSLGRLSTLFNFSGSVHSKGSSQSRVVIPPQVCSIVAAERSIYSPHENIVIDDYIEGIKHAAWVFHRFGTS